LQQTGMSFAWDQELLDDLPAWVLDLEEPADLRAALRRRADVIFDRYPLLHRLTVVNEPLELLGGARYQNHFSDVLGPDYVQEVLRIVADAAPATVELIVNENFVEYSAAKADALVALAAELVAADAPIDGIGLQSHFLFGEPDFARYRQVMEEVAALGLDVHITELDVPVPPNLADRFEVQARRYRQAVEACLDVDACRSITVWGVDDGHTWVDSLFGPGQDPLLFTAQGQPKPAYAAVVAALAAGR
jgi:endo-1,4-beta-xylanase